MTYTSLIDIKTELVNFIRNQDVISTTSRGVTTTTDEFNGDTSTTQFQLTNTTVKNVRSVTVDAAAQTYGVDYTIDLVNAQINFTVAPGNGTDNVDVQYDFGTTDKIYDDYPPIHIKLNQMPRVAIDIIAGTSDLNGIGETSIRTNYTISVTMYSDNKRELEGINASVREALNGAGTTLFTLTHIRALAQGPMIPSAFGSPNEQKIWQRNYDFEAFIANEE